jgi:hypothetical protein
MTDFSNIFEIQGIHILSDHPFIHNIEDPGNAIHLADLIRHHDNVLVMQYFRNRNYMNVVFRDNKIFITQLIDNNETLNFSVTYSTDVIYFEIEYMDGGHVIFYLNTDQNSASLRVVIIYPTIENTYIFHNINNTTLTDSNGTQVHFASAEAIFDMMYSNLEDVLSYLVRVFAV